ncbi:Ig-like domain-containing protein [Photobacterium leiognathi]|uniref:Ig-like domain-containing protein n=1 Tax=Photobacterium leiognathi TaxID=553611 RepID=UPI0027332F94|nr:Ig-like domain-containing protein [Photobacterium leiognathi]
MSTFFKYFFSLIFLPLIIFINGCGTSDLILIKISPSTSTSFDVSGLNLVAGNKQSFQATGYYSDGSSNILTDLTISDWSTSDEEKGYFDAPGEFIAGNTPGTVTIAATKDGITSNTIDITIEIVATPLAITGSTINTINVTPSPVTIVKDESIQLVATANYIDGTSAVITNDVSWLSNDRNTADVTPSGLLNGINTGATTLTASLDGITSNTVDATVITVITNILIEPSTISVVKGLNQQLTATAVFNDGTQSPITNSVTWVSNNTNNASFSEMGLLNGLEEGTATLTAQMDNISTTVEFTVTPAEITQIEVTPNEVTLVKGKTERNAQQLIAIATYTDDSRLDITNSATWLSLDPSLTVSMTGEITASDIGTATVIASEDGIDSTQADITICSLADTCIDIFDAGNGTLFTSSPSKIYVDNINPNLASSVTTVDSSLPPPAIGIRLDDGLDGDYSLFTVSEADSLCDTYSREEIGERDNWRLPTKNELEQFANDNIITTSSSIENMFTQRDWLVEYTYWTNEPIPGSPSNSYYTFNLQLGGGGPRNSPRFVTCISET